MSNTDFILIETDMQTKRNAPFTQSVNTPAPVLPSVLKRKVMVNNLLIAVGLVPALTKGKEIKIE